MKVIKCEMCEGTAFSKEDGFFICQNCGLKYSLEEAKKLMVEVEGKGSPVVENKNEEIVETNSNQL